MIETNNGYKFECSGREILTHGTDGISITVDEQVRCGYDSYVEMWDDVEETYHSNFTDDEKKELALFMIEKWKKFGGLSNGAKHTVIGSLLSFEQCLREEFLVNTQNYPKEYHQLFKQKFERAENRFKEQSGNTENPQHDAKLPVSGSNCSNCSKCVFFRYEASWGHGWCYNDNSQYSGKLRGNGPSCNLDTSKR